MLFEYAERYIVRLYGGDVADLEEGWYLANGQTVNTKLFGSVTLPNLINGTFIKFGNTGADFTDDVVEYTTDCKDYDIEDHGDPHVHTFGFYSPSISYAGTHSHSTVSVDDKVTFRPRYPTVEVWNRPNATSGTLQHYGISGGVDTAENMWYASDASLASAGGHSHSRKSTWANWKGTWGDDGSHNHSILDTEFDTGSTMPDYFEVRAIVFLGPRA